MGIEVRDQIVEMLKAKSRPELDPVDMGSHGRFRRKAQQSSQQDPHGTDGDEVGVRRGRGQAVNPEGIY